MKDGDNLNQIWPHTIHDSVVAVDHLTKCVVANLRDDAPGQRVGLQAFHRGNEPFNEKGCRVGRVACHIQ
jgi:hypothetical protein